jgi:hypothetical protein
MSPMPTSISLIRDVFRECLAEDDFCDLHGYAGPTSVRRFIEYMAAGNVAIRKSGEEIPVRFPDLTNLDMCFAAFLNATVTIEGSRSCKIASFLYDWCKSIALPLIRRAARKFDFGPSNEAAFHETCSKSWESWVTAMSRPEALSSVSKALFEDLEAAYTDRTLLSFFVKLPVQGEYRMWGPRAGSGEGRKLPKRIIKAAGYSVTVTVSKYEEVECSVTAYEWLATLTEQGEAETAAAACGMVYVFDRQNGAPTGGLQDLVYVSDSMTDNDVLQVTSFIDQHRDAARVIHDSDLCFVWIWEKRGGARKGVGADCLTAGLADIRRRFKKVQTVLFDARPAQFVDWTAMDPPMVAVEKQNAIESLVSYIQGLKLSFDVRPIFNRSANPVVDALVAVGRASDGRFGSDASGNNDDDDEVGSIDLNLWSGELSALFRHAGLDDLANDVEEEEATGLEVETALKSLFFDHHVHYLHASSAGMLGAFLSPHGLEKLDLEDALDEVPGFRAFFDSLPQHIRVVEIAFFGVAPVCLLRASTPFGNLLEHYSLVPKPRPFNVFQFLNDIGL